VASYTAPVYKSCSFFSSICLDPTDRFLLTGSSLGQALIWDTSAHENFGACELPVSAQLEVSKVAWATGTRGSLDAQLACISDDKTFSVFDWGLEHFHADFNFKRPKMCKGGTRERIHRDDPISISETEQAQITSNSSSNPASIQATPRKKIQFPTIVRTPQSTNKSILDFFSPSPRVDPNFSQ
jgi:WD40 repeat protein